MSLSIIQRRLIWIRHPKVACIDAEGTDDERVFVELKKGWARDAGYGLHHSFTIGSKAELREKLREVFTCNCERCKT